MTEDTSPTVSSHLLEIAEQREPTETETGELPARIADDGGQYDSIDITQEQVEVLKAKGLIYYCSHCTRTTLELDDDDYAAREYHTKEALWDVDDPKAYLIHIMSESDG